MTIEQFETRLNKIMKDLVNQTPKRDLEEIYNGKVSSLTFVQGNEYYRLFIGGYKVALADGHNMFVHRIIKIQRLLDKVKKQRFNK